VESTASSEALDSQVSSSVDDSLTVTSSVADELSVPPLPITTSCGSQTGKPCLFDISTQTGMNNSALKPRS